jgi:hypothetical protein
MTSQRQALLQSIATIIADYRQGEIPVIDSNHVDRWVNQFHEFGFDEDAQTVILEQMERILKAYYISHRKAQAFIDKALSSQMLLGANPAETILNVQFLQIQTRGNSQNDLLNLCDSSLQTMYGLGIEDCGRNPVSYIYFDDCLYSGNRVRRDITVWLPNAVPKTTLHIIFFGHHTEGFNYSKRIIEQEAQSRNISVHFWKWHEFYNSRWHPSRFDCFWAREMSGDEYVNQYVQAVNERRQNLNRSLPPLFRPNNMPTQDSIFSSPTSRKVIEDAFLKVGAYIVSLPRSPNTSMRPLGYDYLESLGFGANLITYRNIANNCPLALWWGDPDKAHPLNAWYPLFPRTVNITPIPEGEEF